MPHALLIILLLLAHTVIAADENGASPLQAQFQLAYENPSVNGERRQVMRFEVDGLEQYALVLWPAGSAPEGGWPVLLFNHGYHPDPPLYGRNGQGNNDRPGDYYRAIPQAFVDRGMVVVTPDFRGHNASEGAHFTQREDAPLYYARDAVAAFHALTLLPGLDRSRRFMLGHSMGGLVTLAALDRVGADVAAASIWSSMAVPEGLDFPHIGGVPLMVQHAVDDATTAVTGAKDIANQLRQQNGVVELQLYQSADHLFTHEDFEQAVELDMKWFATAWR